MIAYNKVWLDNLLVRKEADSAASAHCLSPAEKEQIYSAYPVGFYHPHFFVRTGLFVLTVIIVAFTMGFFSLFIMDQLNNAGGFLVVIGMLLYGALELMVNKRHYKSGVDDALLWMAAGNIIAGINLLGNVTMQANAIIVFILAVFFFIRFLNAVMAAVAGLALLAAVFFTVTRWGIMARAIVPFIIMAIALLLYFFSRKQLPLPANRHHTNGLQWLCVTALVTVYAAGNYFVVREASVAMFNLVLNTGDDIPFAWLFWIFTIAIPLLYVVRGLQQKDILLLRTGLLLGAAVVFTIRYYYHLLPAETAMLLGGALLIAIAYFATRYLQLPKHGFTAAEQENDLVLDKLQVESLIITQSFSGQQLPADGGTRFGGGSGSGGGASGEF
ncbi:MAG TPA: hypothetical protein VL307_13780 [Chitinophagaceae bacterium]|nr:hypothetical protein [Chitinophagaceae bacterium]